MCPPQSSRQDGLHGADCLTAKEAAGPVALPPPSRLAELRRRPGIVRAHKPLPVDGTGGGRSDKRKPHAGLQAVPRIPPKTSLSHFNALDYLSLALDGDRDARDMGGTEGEGDYGGVGGRKESPVGKICPDSGRAGAGCPSFQAVRGRAWQPTSADRSFFFMCVCLCVCMVWFHLPSSFLVKTPPNH